MPGTSIQAVSGEISVTRAVHCADRPCFLHLHCRNAAQPRGLKPRNLAAVPSCSLKRVDPWNTAADVTHVRRASGRCGTRRSRTGCSCRPSGRWQRKASATNSDRLASLQAEFAAALEEMKRQAERAHKLETKASSRGVL